MASFIDIISEVANRLGLEPISSLDEETTEAQTFAIEAPLVLDRCLSRASWSFNTKTLELSRLADAPTHPLYRYAYAIPSDLIRFDQVLDHSGRIILGDTWTREGDQILTDWSRLLLRYGRRLTQAEFAHTPVPFQTYFSASLGYAVAPKLTGTNTDVQRYAAEVQEAYRVALMDAGRMVAPTPLFAPGSWVR